jgi:hypothetical protein
MFAPFSSHWKVIGAVPVATTANVAVWPGVTVWLAGWVVIAGADGGSLVVVLLLAIPAQLESIRGAAATTESSAPKIKILLNLRMNGSASCAESDGTPLIETPPGTRREEKYWVNANTHISFSLNCLDSAQLGVWGRES